MVIVSPVDFRKNDNIDCGPEAKVIKYREKKVLIFLDLGQTKQSQKSLFIFSKINKYLNKRGQITLKKKGFLHLGQLHIDYFWTHKNL